MLLLFLSSWILIPAPNGFLLPLAVGAPEVSPLLLAGAVLLAGISAGGAKQNGIARLSLVCSASAGVLCLVPIGQLPGTWPDSTALSRTRPRGLQSRSRERSE